MKITILLMLLAGCFCLNSCNTIAGVGKDISNGGELLNNAATKTQDQL